MRRTGVRVDILIIHKRESTVRDDNHGDRCRPLLWRLHYVRLAVQTGRMYSKASSPWLEKNQLSFLVCLTYFSLMQKFLNISNQIHVRRHRFLSIYLPVSVFNTLFSSFYNRFFFVFIGFSSSVARLSSYESPVRVLHNFSHKFQTYSFFTIFTSFFPYITLLVRISCLCPFNWALLVFHRFRKLLSYPVLRNTSSLLIFSIHLISQIFSYNTT